jgi:hypothetical protein
MKTTKSLFLFGFLAMTQFIQAANTANNVDANATRQALGFNALSLIPLLILVIFLVVLSFGTQKIPGMKS